MDSATHDLPRPDAEALPLHQLRAAEERGQRDRMILILLAFFVLAVLATVG
jgi:hypothetical protein